MAVIDGKKLTTYQVAPDGESFRLNFNDAAGAPSAVNLPSDCLNELMTMPRIVAEATRAKYRDDTMRLVYSVGAWKIEGAAGDARFILTLKTPDGFEVAFALGRDDIVTMMGAVDNEEETSTLKQRAFN